MRVLGPQEVPQRICETKTSVKCRSTVSSVCLEHPCFTASCPQFAQTLCESFLGPPPCKSTSLEQVIPQRAGSSIQQLNENWLAQTVQRRARRKTGGWTGRFFRDHYLFLLRLRVEDTSQEHALHYFPTDCRPCSPCSFRSFASISSCDEWQEGRWCNHIWNSDCQNCKKLTFECHQCLTFLTGNSLESDCSDRST